LEASSSRNVELVIVAGFMSWLNTALTGISTIRWARLDFLASY
jgi:hypothetical protein